MNFIAKNQMENDPLPVAVKLFTEGFNCAQAMLAAFAERYDLDRSHALKIASGFGGGLARIQSTCGAVTGAAMVIGLEMGHSSPGDLEAKEKTYATIREFTGKFQGMHGSIDCRQLLGCSLETDEGKQHYRDNNLSEKVCLACIRDSVKLLKEIL